MGTDLLAEKAKEDDFLELALNIVDGLPKMYNTVSVARTRVAQRGPIDVVGTITGVPESVPPNMTANDYKDPERSEALSQGVIQFFVLEGDGSAIPCAFHNVTGLRDYPYGKDEDEYERLAADVLDACRYGYTVTVTGRFVNMVSHRQRQRVLYVDHINVEDSALQSKITPNQFDKFMELCDDADVTPLDVFMDEVFAFFDADDYLKKTIALFMLSPKSASEMLHILILSAPGEGKDYLIDKIIQPTVRCGKLEGNQQITVAALIGAMDKNDLSSVGQGFFSKYHRERSAVSEIQTWDSEKFSALLGLMSTGKVNLSKGKVTEKSTDACENILMAGNIPNTWTEGMDYMRKLDSVLGPKNREYVKQFLSRFTLIFAKVSLLKNPDSWKKSQIILRNIDADSAMSDGEKFARDTEIKTICMRDDISNREKSRLIRERKITIMRDSGMGDDKIIKRLRFAAFQEFFGQYFKYVSNRPMPVEKIDDVLHRTLNSMADRPELKGILKTEAGSTDSRKLPGFTNLCKGFARVHGHCQIEKSDIDEAVDLYMESMSTMVENFGADILASGLEMVELDMLRFIAQNQGCTVDDVKHRLKFYSSFSDEMFNEHMDHIESYIKKDGDRLILLKERVSGNLLGALNIEIDDDFDEEIEANRKKSIEDFEEVDAGGQ